MICVYVYFFFNKKIFLVRIEFNVSTLCYIVQASAVYLLTSRYTDDHCRPYRTDATTSGSRGCRHAAARNHCDSKPDDVRVAVNHFAGRDVYRYAMGDMVDITRAVPGPCTWTREIVRRYRTRPYAHTFMVHPGTPYYVHVRWLQ